MSKGDKLVEVYTAADELEARIIKDVLASNDIGSVIVPRGGLPSVYSPVQALGTYQVMVLENMAEKARELLASDG